MQEILREAGLSQTESTVYLELSKTGMASGYKVAKNSKLFKANTYEALKSLEHKGLVSKKVIDEKTVFEATAPSFFLDMLNKKKENIDRIIPSIRVLQQTTKGESTFKHFKGIDPFINILYQFLKSREPIYVYGAPKVAYELLKNRIGHFHNERIKQKIRMYHIYNFEAADRIQMLKKMPFTPVGYLPQLFDTQVSTNICADQVVFVIWVPPIKIIQIQ